MNDFTKEELEIISMAISDLVVINNEDSEKSSLYQKISSMIDNYCNHDDAYIYSKVKICLNCERSME